MYILNFLNDLPELQSEESNATFEYRLLCSGELYNANILTADWRNSDGTRIIVDKPFTLIVCSHPFNEYPQELALRFSVPRITEKQGNCTSTFHPDDDIARDVAVLMTLYCRRLITVTAKIREIHPMAYENEPPYYQDWPIGFIKSLKPTHWESKPSVVIYGPDGITGVTDYNPPPHGIDTSHLKRFLLSLPNSPYAESIVLSARMYALALEQLERDVDVAYQLLISSIETIANAAMRSFMPSHEDMISTKKSVAVLAKDYGLSEEQSQSLAIEACKDIPWASRKFIKFLLDNTTDDLLNEDELFKTPSIFLPDKNNFERELAKIYTARGKLLHGGHSFPESSVIGIGPTMPSRIMPSLYNNPSETFPPIVWFERVVNNALNNFIERSLLSESNTENSTTMNK